jgi:hypothetical protein
VKVIVLRSGEDMAATLTLDKGLGFLNPGASARAGGPARSLQLR